MREALGRRRVRPDARRELGRIAFVQRLGAARVIRDGDHNLQAAGRAGKLVELGEQRRQGRRARRRQLRVDEHKGVGGHEGEARYLVAPVDARAPLGMRRRPAEDTAAEFVHPITLFSRRSRHARGRPH